MRKIFAVNLLIEYTQPADGWDIDDSAKLFKQDLEETFFEDFPEYRTVMVETLVPTEDEFWKNWNRLRNANKI